MTEIALIFSALLKPSLVGICRRDAYSFKESG
jgi:hypothetical protein